MNTGEQTQGAPEGAPALTPAEQAAVEKGRQGFSEPTNVLATPPSGPQRPEGVPEKFWDAEKGVVNTEALIKSYTELERARSQPQQEPAATGSEQQNPPAPVAENGKIERPKADEQAPTVTLTDAIAAAQAEYGENKQVSDATIETLEKAGIPREVFALYLKGVEAQEQATVTTVHSIVGGKDAYEEMARWAATKLSDAELDAFNAALDNDAMRENAVRGLYARFTEARPNEGNMIAPTGNSSATSGDVYTTRDQLIADQKDARYQTDASFRQQVQDKLIRSQATGFQLVQRPLFERQILRS